MIGDSLLIYVIRIDHVSLRSHFVPDFLVPIGGHTRRGTKKQIKLSSLAHQGQFHTNGRRRNGYEECVRESVMPFTPRLECPVRVVASVSLLMILPTYRGRLSGGGWEEIVVVHVSIQAARSHSALRLNRSSVVSDLPSF